MADSQFLPRRELYYEDTSSPKTGFTEREIELLNKCKKVLPPPFLAEWQDDDLKILSFIQLVVDDINYEPPLSGYLVNTLPVFLDTIVVLGAQMYAMLFMAAKWTMNDITLNEGGVNLTIERTSKLTGVQEKFLKLYEDKKRSVKRNQMFVKVLGTPRYGANLAMLVRQIYNR